MSDDFGTISINRAKFARHREALQKLAADAPTEHLANEYRRLLGEIDAQMLNVEPVRSTDAGMRPLVTGPATNGDESFAYDEPPRSGSGARVVLIIAAALIALAVIAGLIWMASRDRNEPGEVVEQTTTATTSTTTTTAAPDTVAEPVITSILSATPASHDYGTIRKGTRATRQFEVRNASDEPVTISVARSACRCLFYEYRSAVPPKGKETVTVTIDGARAKAGALQETVKVTKKNDPSVETSFEVAANIQ
ncbi:MAG TPA: DUF1573 domain-containing protein [Thermoanaerobaculia bacterium]|nr:DUF1573 domain-containing protein [Thermoanaerobaculia bacterium]